jgi:hypothetical protein
MDIYTREDYIVNNWNSPLNREDTPVYRVMYKQ